MSYTFHAPGWGVFDHDSVDRTLAARYYATAYRALGQLPPRVASLVQADLRTSLAAFRRLDFRSAVLNGRDAYERAMDALGPSAATRLSGPAKRPVPKEYGRPHPGTIDPPDGGPAPAPGKAEIRRSGAGRAQQPLPRSSLRDEYLERAGR